MVVRQQEAIRREQDARPFTAPPFAAKIDDGRPQHLGHLAATRVGHVVEVGAEPLHVGLRLAHLAGGRLGGRNPLDQLPEEADVEVAARVSDGQVVELGG